MQRSPFVIVAGTTLLAFLRDLQVKSGKRTHAGCDFSCQHVDFRFKVVFGEKKTQKLLGRKVGRTGAMSIERVLEKKLLWVSCV